MKRLFTTDYKDYEADWPRSARPSARGIILIDNISDYSTLAPHDKIALVYSTKHQFYKFPGGGIHEGEENTTALIREVTEETSVKNLKVLGDGKIMTIDALPVAGHMKRGKYVSAHVHFSAAYIFEADENEPIQIKPDENSKVAWVPLDKVVELSTEPHMKPAYQKLVDIAKTL